MFSTLHFLCAVLPSFPFFFFVQYLQSIFLSNVLYFRLYNFCQFLFPQCFILSSLFFMFSSCTSFQFLNAAAYFLFLPYIFYPYILPYILSFLFHLDTFFDAFHTFQNLTCRTICLIVSLSIFFFGVLLFQLPTSLLFLSVSLVLYFCSSIASSFIII